MTHTDIIWFANASMADIQQIGGKNASLGEMISHLSQAGVKVPNGFATSVNAFQQFMRDNDLNQRIYGLLDQLNVDDVKRLAEVGQQIRTWILQADFSASFQQALAEAYQTLSQDNPDASFAVRSSATAEDLPDASFAGQQETFLNVSGFEGILLAVKRVYASLFTDRAIAYRVHHNFSHEHVGISAGIQRMVRSDLAASGVMFSLDTESGFEQVVFITGAYGLGETVVQGEVNPDEFYVYKPSLKQHKPAILQRTLGSKALKMIFADETSEQLVKTIDVTPEQRQQFCLSDDEIEFLAQQALIIEQHYQQAMDIEWAKDGHSGELFIVQARPETVKHRHKHQQVSERYQLQNTGTVLVTGRSIGQKIGQGRARLLQHAEQMDIMQDGDVLVTDMTDPDWEPIMKRASAIITNRGGRTCHAAIIARELGIPAVVGCQDATEALHEGDLVTVSCAEGDTGKVYEGLLDFKVHRTELDNMPDLPFKLMMNVANPERAFAFHNLPNHGVGLARLEFIIAQHIGIHPNALLQFEELSADLKTSISQKISAYASPREYYVERLKEGIATIAAAFAPNTVIVRMSDFKSNEYANLLGGRQFEPQEENPMLGFRGASRYVSEQFRDAFIMECDAIKRVRNDMGLTNVWVMIPFVRTVAEGEKVIALLREQGLVQGENGLKIIMMCELPTNALLANQYLDHFDGFSIGSNDLTQLTLGLDRDSGLVAAQFDERDQAVKQLLSLAISACKKRNKYIGICGQGPSDHPDLAKWLVEQGIESMSLNPDSIIDTWLFLAKFL